MKLVNITLSNEELIAKCREWISRLCKSGGKDWTLTVPPIIDRDPDFLFTELCDRFQELSPAGATEVVRDYCQCSFAMIRRGENGKAYCFECKKEIDEGASPDMAEALREGIELEEARIALARLSGINLELPRWVHNARHALSSPGVSSPGERHMPESIVRELVQFVAGNLQNMDAVIEQFFTRLPNLNKIENLSQQGDGC